MKVSSSLCLHLVFISVPFPPPYFVYSFTVFRARKKKKCSGPAGVKEMLKKLQEKDALKKTDEEQKASTFFLKSRLKGVVWHEGVESVDSKIQSSVL